MNTDIRGYIINNFKNSSLEDIRSSIVESIQNKDEITLPGLGVFFELLWNSSDEECKKKMINMISDSVKKGY